MAQAPATRDRGYRGGRYRGRPRSSRLVLFALVLGLTLWLIGPFVWLFVTSVSYQRKSRLT